MSAGVSHFTIWKTIIQTIIQKFCGSNNICRLHVCVHRDQQLYKQSYRSHEEVLAFDVLVAAFMLQPVQEAFWRKSVFVLCLVEHLTEPAEGRPPRLGRVHDLVVVPPPEVGEVLLLVLRQVIEISTT